MKNVIGDGFEVGAKMDRALDADHPMRGRIDADVCEDSLVEALATLGADDHADVRFAVKHAQDRCRPKFRDVAPIHHPCKREVSVA